MGDPAGTDARDHELSAELEDVTELEGSLASQPDEERLMRSVLEHDEQAFDDGKLALEAVDRSVGSFTPDLLFEQLVKNYRNAERLYGKTLLRALTGWSPDYLRRNISIPEFQEELRQRLDDAVAGLERRGMLDSQGSLTDDALTLAALVLYAEELERLQSKGLGRQTSHEPDSYGERDEDFPFGPGFRFRDISLRKSVRTAVRRGHRRVELADLRAQKRIHEGRIQVIYAVDSSGSMRGEKLRMAKRAGVALCYKALEDKDEAGLIVFTGRIEAAIPPTREFLPLLTTLAQARAGMETDLAQVILQSVELFQERGTKHLVLLTDAVPTSGREPRQATLEAASVAAEHQVRISIVGIGLDEEGKRLAEEIVEIADGRFYVVTDLAELDTIVLEEYARIKH